MPNCQMVAVENLDRYSAVAVFVVRVASLDVIELGAAVIINNNNQFGKCIEVT